MVNPQSKKQSWYPAPMFDDTLPTIKSLTKTKHEPGKRGIRRSSMLNKIFMKQITDLMSTGTVAMNIVGRGIEISKVKVTPDFQTVNVFWVCKGTASDDETELVLQKVAGALRHELSTLRIMGEIPYIVFVKDKQEAQIADLNNRLAVADYGEDYVMTEEGHLLKSEFVLNTKLSPEVKAKIKQLEDELPVDEEPLPEMSNNVFGLDHTKIMNRLLAARKKTSDAWNNLDANSDVISYRAPVNALPEPSISTQTKELADFLLQRQILNKKIAQRTKNTRDDWQLQVSSLHEDPDYNPDEYYYDDVDDLDEEEDEEYYHGGYESDGLEELETATPKE
ncbi:unnamed protein product [Arctia plantaginis]|uniref:Ribosome-binding factor A, mitochondrial n=1 Tax=Arctia plantaginis TaxID=874455 RepID=A0A8S1BEQ9_ARCPL|nr:unnamed protein product [Arctia plantaginis]